MNTLSFPIMRRAVMRSKSVSQSAIAEAEGLALSTVSRVIDDAYPAATSRGQETVQRVRIRIAEATGATLAELGWAPGNDNGPTNGETDAAERSAEPGEPPPAGK